ncbi:uncharacterized protein [Temnothorax longispinosus]|uniref:uncharacterized protein n=1 Tax=Temnothorax longispinosus TaxID=300112 RepID=UPI003A990596
MREIHQYSVLASENPTQQADFMARYPTVAKVVDDFEGNHLRIIQDVGDDEFETEDKIREEFDRLRFAVVGRYEKLARAARKADPPAPSSASRSAIRLPKLALPQFSGDLALWPTFIALFDAAVHNNLDVTVIEKFQHLLTSLSGEALGVVKHLPLTVENYPIAYDALQARYSDKRELAKQYWRAVVHAEPLVGDTPASLRALLDGFTENTRALGMLGYPVKAWDFMLYNHLLEKLTPTLREKFEASHMSVDSPSFDQLVQYLSSYCSVLTSVAGPSAQSGKSKPSTPAKKGAATTSLVTRNAACVKCGEQHLLAKCAGFLQLSARERHDLARDKGLCLNCLRSGHNLKTCPSSWTCRSCKSKHHSLLHFEQANTVSPATVPSIASGASESAPSTIVENKPIVSMASVSNSVVLLSTVRAEALDVRGNAFPVRMLLDSASQANFITESCLRRGGFARTRHSVAVLGVNETKAATTRGLTSLVIRVKNRGDLRFPIEATVLPRITSPLPNHRVDSKDWSHLTGLPLADPEYHLPGSIDILLGADSFVSVLRDGRRTGRAGEPDAFNTAFGWVLMGAVSPALQVQPLHTFATTLESIDAAVEQFWRLEDVPEHPPRSEEDQRCIEFFERTTYRDHSGRFVVSYPFASGLPTFVDSRPIAVNRLRALERRFKSNLDFRQSYNAFMQDYLDSGHMTIASEAAPPDGRVYYLPHHGVHKLDSTTTKLRVVFDASAKCPNGLSLNDTILSGPKLQPDIVAVLLRFRAKLVALTADVKQMFRQIWITPEHRDYQRIVWRFSESDPILDYLLNTVTFGNTASPFLAIYCLLQLARENRERYPLVYTTLLESLYVDDVVASVRSVGQAVALRDQLLELFRGAGFELRKWASSHSEALEGLDPSICSDAMLSFESADDQVLKVLGLRWHSQSDTFGFQINPLNRNCTKRTILSEVARVFDPLGFLTPLTFTAKCLIQRLWTLKLEWDDEPPLEVRRQWERYQSEFDALTALRIPRTFPVGDNIRYELHGFCDASELGYGAVIYLRVVAPSESKRLLLCAKSKVAPLRAVSLPRLELCAALLLADLTAYVRQVLRGHTVIDTERAWSDSTVALCWIRSSPHRWKTFVRNRVARIQERIPIAAWGHVPTDQNPADHCSRGLFPRDLVASSMWWEGPEWLTDFETHVEPVLSEESLPREEERITSLVSLDPPGSLLALLDRFSSLDKICRIVAYVSRFLSRSRARPAPATLAVDQHESHSALLTLIKLVQQDSFEEEIDRLGHRKGLPKPFLKLAPFLDPTGLLRVGGRLIHSGLAYETKHPILLPNKHRLTDLIIEREHRANLHPGRRTLQYLLAQQFWILGVHRAIRRVLSACYRCFRANPRPSQPLMAELPVDRVSQVKPFSVSGVDFAGPFTLVTRRARGVSSFKAYVCLFVCFAVKAVHLEAALSLTTESFLAALRRFVARRGRCSLLYSDCGTNFVGASRELAAHMRGAAERERIRWSFNPPSAPHFGGLWESGVKSFKTHLRRVVGEQILTLEEFATVLAQIESVLNSRPLCPVSTDPLDLEVLSPGHFLTMEPLVAIPSPDLTPLPVNHLGRWQLIQRIHQDFWRRWHHEYLCTLQQRPKWWTSANPLAVGSLVLIREENASPLQWKRGRVESLHPGRDGVPRVATVRVTGGSIVRPLVKLCPLPMGTLLQATNPDP